MKNNIILIGMRGSGKTTVSKIISEKLNMQNIDSDEYITKQEKSSIQEIVDKHGWDYFRQKETDFLKAMKSISSKQFVLSTGGGIILKEENRALLRDLGVVYYLFAYPEVSAKRIEKFDESRPMLTKSNTLLEDLQKTFKERKEIYEEAADHIIHTDKISPEEVANTILAYYLIANV